ncbi:MAG: metallophosphoesterase [Bacillota bacterium]|nr:metallophosphoesterase [Bacillota bacterium]
MITIIRILLYFFLIGVILGVYVFLEPFRLEEKDIIVVNGDIPRQFENTRIIFLTDIHHGPFFSKSRLRKLVKRVNSLQPDIILLGGDYVHRSPDYIESCFDELKKLEAGFGVYGVLGNHDHWEDGALTIQSMKDAGIHLIDNLARWIEKNGEQIKIGGVGDYLEDIQDINPTIADVKNEDFVVLVTHNPDYVEHLKTDKIDLVFAGHTHGGQVTFLGLWAPIIPSENGQKYRTGIIETDNTKVIVSNGVGTITPPVRFFARPQIIIAHLRSEPVSAGETSENQSPTKQ